MALDLATLSVKVDSRGAVLGSQRAASAIRKVGVQAATTTTRLGKLKASLFSVKAGLAAIGTGVLIKGLSNATRAAANFEKGMAEVSTLLGDVPDEIDALTQSSKALAVQFGTAPVEQTKAFYQIISAGASSAAEATDILTIANKLAIGGVTNIETAADGLTSVLNAYGDQVESATAVSDAMFVAMRAGKTTIGELSAALGLVAPLAAQTGVSFDELTATVAALTKGGISTGIAVSGVRAILAAIVKPTKEAADEMERLGIKVDSAALAEKGLAGVLKEVSVATKGSTESVAQLFGGVEALIPVLALAGQAGVDLGDILGQMPEKAGSTDTAFKKMAETGDLAFKRMTAAIDVISIALGAKILPLLADVATAFANLFKEDTPQQKMAKLAKEINELNKVLAIHEKQLETNALLGTLVKAERKEVEELTAQYNALADALKRRNIAESERAAKKEKTAVVPTGPAPLGGDLLDDITKILEDEKKASEALVLTLSDLRKSREDENRLMQVTGAERQKLSNAISIETAKRNALRQSSNPSDLREEFVLLDQSQKARDVVIDKVEKQRVATKALEKAKIEDNKLTQEAKGIIEDLLNPYEQYEAKLVRITELLQKKKLTEEQAATATQQAKRAMLESIPAIRSVESGIDSLVDKLLEGELSFKSLGATVKSVMQEIAGDILKSGIKDLLLGGLGGGSGGGLFSGLGSLFGGLFSSGSQLQVAGDLAGGAAFSTPFAKGGTFSGGKVTPFARGGIVNGPTLFPMANGAGLMGEAGPEAVVPLKRGKDGKLGIAGGGGGGMVINIDARGSNGDAAVEEAVERGIRRAAPALINASVNKVKDDRQRDPAFFGGVGA